MSNPIVTINLVVLNGDKYIRLCLDGILAQAYPKELIELNILDNGSADGTTEAIKNYGLSSKGFSKFNLVESKINLGMWPGQEELLKYSSGKYVLSMAVDVILDKEFIKNAAGEMEKDENIGALEAKIYRYDLADGQPQFTKIIDTLGFQIFRSRRVINIGHGQEDKGQFDEPKEIFGVEGAAPFFRKEALESCKIEVGPRFEIFDRDYFWYGDDLDIAWRMNLFGWKQVFYPTVIAWHDRQTTKKLKQNFRDFLHIRRAIPLKKRQLEWGNIRFTIIKNDYIINILKDLPYVLKRELAMLAYLIIFEPKVFAELPNFIKLMPKMMRKRKEIMKRAKSAGDMRKFFQ